MELIMQIQTSNTSTVKPEFDSQPVGETKASFRKSEVEKTSSDIDRVTISNKGQFALDVQTFAKSVEAPDRLQFVNFLREKFSDSLSPETISFIEKDLGNEEPYQIKIDSSRYTSKTGLSSEAVNRELTISVRETSHYSGRSYNSLGAHKFESSQIGQKITEVLNQEKDSLDQQDINATQSLFEQLSNVSRQWEPSMEGVIHIFNEFERAEHFITELNVGVETKSSLMTAVEQLKTGRKELLLNEIQVLENKISEKPMFSDSIQSSLNKTKELLKIEKKLDLSLNEKSQSILSSRNTIFNIDQNLKSLEKLGHEKLDDMLNFLNRERENFDRYFIERDWQKSHSFNQNNSTLEFQSLHEESANNIRALKAMFEYEKNQSTIDREV